jgi:hypothetical protein
VGVELSIVIQLDDHTRHWQLSRFLNISYHQAYHMQCFMTFPIRFGFQHIFNTCATSYRVLVHILVVVDIVIVLCRSGIVVKI